MKKTLSLIASLFLLNGCAETLALLGPASSAFGGGNIVQSSLSSAANYGIKKSTGKTPMQHAIAYAEEKNPQNMKKRCVSFIEITNSEFCAIEKKQAALTKDKIEKKTKDVVKKIPLIKKDTDSKKVSQITVISKRQAFAKARKEGKDSFIFNGKTYKSRLNNLIFVEKKN